MQRFLWTLLRWIALPFLLVLAQALALALWHSARAQGFSIHTFVKANFLFLLAGIFFRIIFNQCLQRFNRHDPIEFFDTLEHELTHALFGYLTFSPPVSLSASLKSGGEVELQGSNPFAALAPYFFPLWAVLAMGIGLVVQSNLKTHWNYGLFFLLGSNLYRLAREYRWRQTDLHLYGFFFSTCLVVILFLITWASLFSVAGLWPWSWFNSSIFEFTHLFRHWLHKLF